MHIGSCRMTFYLPGNDSLKGKRQVSRSLMTKLRQKFNLSVAEVDAIASRTLSDAEGLAHGTVDYAIGRVTPILILAFLGILILILVYRFVPQRVRVN